MTRSLSPPPAGCNFAGAARKGMVINNLHPSGLIRPSDAVILGQPTPNENLREAMPAMWRKPKIVEIAVGMEINSYACAEIA